MNNNAKQNGESPGIQYGAITVSETTAGMEKFHARQGHGFAAERAEHLNDYLDGKDAHILGDDNALDGADRIVNGREIQSKYCASGTQCVAACFKDGHFRYYSANGKVMLIEVPADMYDDAVQAMRNRISNGEVEGVTNPDYAEKIIKKGNYTYEQVKAIAKSGTIESLTFDATNGAIIAVNAMGISAAVAFAVSIWNGDDLETAAKNAAISGIKVGGVAFLTTILASQAARAGLTAELKVGTDFLVKSMGNKVSSYISSSLKTGGNIYGAAASNNVSKLLRGNIVANVITVALLSSVDIISAFRGRISSQQLFKNVTTVAGTVTGGTAGWAGGAAIGSAIGSVVPVIGNAIGATVGGFVGSMVGGSIGSTVAHKAMDEVIEDDANKMLKIIETEIDNVTKDIFLTQQETNSLIDLIQQDLSSDMLKDMFASEDYEGYANSFVRNKVNEVTRFRQNIILPTEEEMLLGIRGAFENAIEGNGIFGAQEEKKPMELEQDELLKNCNIQHNQLDNIMRPVNAMNQIQIKMENRMAFMRNSEREYNEKRKSIHEERDVLKAELNTLLK